MEQPSLGHLWSSPPLDLGLPGMCCVIREGCGPPTAPKKWGAFPVSWPRGFRGFISSQKFHVLPAKSVSTTGPIPGACPCQATVLRVLEISSYRILAFLLDGGLLLLLSPFTHKGTGPERGSIAPKVTQQARGQSWDLNPW